ncbi:MAG: hypothetical protein R8J84_09205 [Mariprofundales bacterium]
MSNARYVGALLLALWLPLSLAQGEEAQEDGRFSVDLPLAVGESWQQLRQQGLDRVLDRILSRTERGKVGSRLSPGRFLMQVIPSAHQVHFRFRQHALLDRLQARGLHPLVDPPRIALQLTMADTAGQRLPQTEVLLRQRAERMATHLGIVLAGDGVSLALHWRWVDDHWVALTVDGDGEVLAALGGEHQIDSQAPMAQFTQWMMRILQRARDTVYPVGDWRLSDSYAEAAPPAQEVLLTIYRTATLAEQVGMEQVLIAQPQVKALIPLSLDRSLQRYRLRVAGTAWLATWFAHRGMEAQAVDGGWEVH